MILQLWLERLSREWPREFVAEKAGVTSETIRLLESGKRKPSFDVLVKLLDLFGYNDPRQLFAVADNTPNSTKS